MPKRAPKPEPVPLLFACIDVGTNSTKMTIADLADGKAETVYEQSAVTRLGEGMNPHEMFLREAPMRRTLDALEELATAALARNVEGLAAVGTAALRDAENRDEFLRRAGERTGIKVEIIPGEEEARLSYLAVRRDPQWRGEARLMVIDIGGGSTEIIQGAADSDAIASRISVNLGAVKLTEGFLRSDPPTVAQYAAASEAAQEQFRQVAIPADAETVPIVGVGGTFTNLAAMDYGAFAGPETLHGYKLTSAAVDTLITRLANASVAERKTMPGLDPRRADIILGGAILLSQALARLGSAALTVSTRGLRWGVLYDRFLRKI